LKAPHRSEFIDVYDDLLKTLWERSIINRGLLMSEDDGGEGKGGDVDDLRQDFGIRFSKALIDLILGLTKE
jgi:hypothetical protein